MNANLIDTTSETEFVLCGPAVTIGRDENNDIQILAQRISRYHAEIRLEDGFWMLEDQGSTYGTYVNGKKVERSIQLHDNDTISLGPSSDSSGYTFVFREAAEQASPASRSKNVVRQAAKRKDIAGGQTVLERESGSLVVRMADVFRRGECDELFQSIKEELEKTASSVVLDVTDVTYLNSYGLSILVKLGFELQKDGLCLRVFGAKGTVLKLMMYAGVNSPIELCDTWEEALESQKE